MPSLEKIKDDSIGDQNDALQESTIVLGRGEGRGRVLKPGDIVGGSYRLKNLIGRGGMGYVYRAEHTIIEHDYALKVLAPENLNELSWRRLESEGRAIAALDHANIVKVYNMGVDAGDCPYYVMDLLSGISLADLIRFGRKMEIELILDIFMQMARGRAYAHSKGIIHRDIKPSNVVLLDAVAGRYQVKLVDFGMAKLLKSVKNRDQRLTAAGQVFGTPFYMSPEQCLGKEVDARTDIYSLGCTLFESLTGRRPYRGSSPLDTVMMHLNEPVPDCGNVCSDKRISLSLDTLIRRMMAKHVADRYSSMMDVEHDLQRIKDGKEIGRSVVFSDDAYRGFSSGVSFKSVQRVESLSQLAVSESKSKQAFSGLALLKTLLICAGVGILGIGCAFSLFSCFQPNAKHSRAQGDRSTAVHTLSPSSKRDADFDHYAAPGASLQDSDAPSENFITKDSRVEKSGKVFTAVEKIDATVSGGSMIIHFPSYPVGLVNTGDGRLIPASGNLRVPTGANLGLYINWNQDPSTLYHDDVFDKIDPAIFSYCSLMGFDEVAVADSRLSSGNSAQLTRAIRHVLSTIAGWPKLKELRLRQCEPIYNDDEAFNLIDQCQHLQVFSARGGEINPTLIIKHKFLFQLTELDLNRTADIDIVLRAISSSKNLEKLLIDDTNPSTRGLAALGTCCKLHELGLQCPNLSTAHFEKISQLPHLEKVWLTNLRSADADLKILSQSKSLKLISLASRGISNAEKRRLLKAFPLLTFDDQYEAYSNRF